MDLLLYAIIINIITVPLANYLNNLTYYTNYTIYASILSFIAIEIAVILIESVILFVFLKNRYLKSLGISTAANVITAVASLFVPSLFYLFI